MKKRMYPIIYIVSIIVSIILIGCAFSPVKCYCRWSIWQNILISIGGGLLSSTFLAFMLFLIDLKNNETLFLLITAPIKMELKCLFSNLLQLINEVRNVKKHEAIVVENENLTEILSIIKEELKTIKIDIAPYSVSNSGIANIDTMEGQNLGNQIKKVIDEKYYLNDVPKKFEKLYFDFTNNEISINGNLTSAKNYAHIKTMLELLKVQNKPCEILSDTFIKVFNDINLKSIGLADKYDLINGILVKSK